MLMGSARAAPFLFRAAPFLLRAAPFLLRAAPRSTAHHRLSRPGRNGWAQRVWSCRRMGFDIGWVSIAGMELQGGGRMEPGMVG